jgi:glycine/D-amino acid oxidase-like deaminating enzyme
MDLLSSCPFWPIRDGLPDTFPALDRDTSCEVAVIGAGISGAFIASFLAGAGIDTVVLDRREAAHGSTAGNTGLMLYELDVPLYRLAAMFGSEFAARVYHRCCDTIDVLERLVRREKIECGFTRKTSMLLAADRSHVPRLRREYEARVDSGFAVEWWTRQRLAAESSLPHPAAILSQDAAQLDAYQLTYGLLASARKAGARVYDRTEMTHHAVRSRGVELTTRCGARVRARHLVIANGYEAGIFLPTRLMALHSTFALVTEPVTTLSGWPADRTVMWDTGNPYLYLRTTSEPRILIGGYDEPFRDPRERDRMLPQKVTALKRRLHQLFPDIPVEVAYSWAGTFAVTAHGLPIIGRHAEIPHTIFALGYGGNGITFSLIAAEIVRDAILGRPHPDAELFGFEPPLRRG